ncbi:MAG: sugar transferase [Candidatus Ornithospirochaeta sp.]
MYQLIKRAFDFILSLAGIIIFSPIFVIIAISIKVDTKGPVFFKQKRAGKNGKPLYIYKFRTMVTNAEELIATFSPEQKKEWEENYKLKDDPRITRVGKLLRKTSLDELPQLINILKGEMSIVGPRPVVEEELSWYENDVDTILSVKPGLTGWWAVNGRSEVPYPKRCDLEMYYVRNACLLLDIKILFYTIKAVFSQKGAV